MLLVASLLMLVAVTLSVCIPSPVRVWAPARAPLAMAATYPEYMNDRMAAGESSTLHEFEGTPASFGASSALCDEDLLTVAQQAAEQAGTGSFTGTEIIIAFNAWKLAQGRTYTDATEEGLALRAFAADQELIEEYMQAAESALFGGETGAAEAEVFLSAMLSNDEWRKAYDKAAERRASAEKMRVQATAGMSAAEDRRRLALASTSKHEEAAREIAQQDYTTALKRAEEHASSERGRLAQELALVNAEEKDARKLAEKQYGDALNTLQATSAKVIASAQADRAGALHKWKSVGKQALADIDAAETDMSAALAQAREQAQAAKEASEKRAQATLTAQAEAKALLELLRQTKEEAAMISSKARADKQELEAAVELANKRARKAKLAAAAALEDL
jgi:hypothetical protein